VTKNQALSVVEVFIESRIENIENKSIVTPNPSTVPKKAIVQAKNSLPTIFTKNPKIISRGLKM